MTVADEVLATWRDAERLLDMLPPIDPDHEMVRLAVAYVRLTYEAVANGDTVRRSHVTLTESRDTIAAARQLLAKIRAKSVRRRPTR